MSARSILARLRRTGLYAILDDGLGDARLLERRAASLARAGVWVFQLRVKRLSDTEAWALGRRLRRVLRDRALLMNDRCDLARACDADGVHLGRDDIPPAAARRILGRGTIVGVSAGSRSEMSPALRSCPDYVSVGPAYRTSTKRDAGRPLGPRGVRRLAGLVPAGIPVLAVGGITPDNVGALIGSGVDAVAAASGLTRSPDPGRTARRFLDAVAAARKR